jgi:hypothetical protein
MRGNIGMQEAIERQARALVFEIIDHGAVQEAPPLTKEEILILVAILSFFGSFPLLAVLLGAFDQRILDATDIARLGLAPIGEIPAFAGDGAREVDMRRRGPHGVNS